MLFDVVMQVTINLEPFNGTISLDHYGFNPCEFQNLHWSQLNGQYEDIVYYGRHKDPYLTCVSNRTKFALESHCRKIDSNESFHSFMRDYTGRLIESIANCFLQAVKIEFRM